MAISLPENLPRHRFRHPAEFEVYQSLVSGLRDDWVVIPSLEMRLDGSFTEREMDILLLHRNHGLILIEVKSFPMRVESGRFFYEDGGPVDKDPLHQLEAQRNFLFQQLKDLDAQIFSKIRIAIATPATINITGELPRNLRSEQLLDSARLADPDAAIGDLVFSDLYTVPLGSVLFEAIIERLAPNATLDTSPAGIRAIARARMERRLETETKVLESLDENHRVLVTGGAGSGKTRLAVAWARRASARDERVLYTCYNDPLGHASGDELSGFEDITVAPFLRYLETAPGLPPLSAGEEDESPRAYWKRVENHAVEHFSEIIDAFDTIIVDEAQDFSPIWLAMLEELLDPEGPRRIFMVGDPGQSIRKTGFRLLTNRDGWVRAELVSNNRNAPAIASLLRQKLGGAASPNVEPYASDIMRTTVETDEEVLANVEAALARVDGEPTWVLTTSSSTRDLLRWRLGLVEWERRDQGIVCETVYRVKGLEVDRVILVADAEEDPERLRQLLYSGVSRALEHLEIIAPASVIARV